MQKAIQKFRPVLSAKQILHIISLAKKDGSAESLDVLGQLVIFEFKIQNATIRPAYTEHKKPTLSESMGFDDPVKSSGESEVNPESLYNSWLVKPESLTIHQLESVRQWRYDHDKMTMDEEKKFEEEVLGLKI